MKNLPRSLSRSHPIPNCFKPVWKRRDRLGLWTNSGD